MSSMASAALLAEPMPRLQEAIDRLAQEDLELVPAASLGDDLRGLRSAIDRLEAEFSRRLERFDRNQGYVPSGYCSAAGWLNVDCRMTCSTAWERVRQAPRLAELPATSEAFAAGEVNLSSNPATTIIVLAGRTCPSRPDQRASRPACGVSSSFISGS